MDLTSVKILITSGLFTVAAITGIALRIIITISNIIS